MSRHKKAPPRQPTVQEQQELTRISRSRVTPVAEVIRATIRLVVALVVARSYDRQTAARSVDHRSGDAVPHLVARPNVEGSAVQTRRRRLGSS